MKERINIRFLAGIIVWAAAALFESAYSQTSVERGVGPYTVNTKRGEITARLLRREGDMIWIDRQVQSGQWVETGLPKSDIIECKAPRPPEFVTADRIAKNEEIPAVVDQLRKMIAKLRAFRDLPGIPVDEAILITARLNEQREFWREALQQYEELLSQPYPIDDRQRIRYLSGLCLWKMQEKEKALGYLLDNPVPEEDLALLSSVLQARGDCLAATKRHREAIDCYLSLIVFYPYEQSNEVRALSRIIPNYIELGEWDAVMKTFDALQAAYPEAPETAEASALLAKHSEKVESEKEFQVKEE